MTMPKLMNCPHSGDGWCLGCLRELDNESRRLIEQARENLHAMEECWLHLKECICSFDEAQKTPRGAFADMDGIAAKVRETVTTLNAWLEKNK